MKQKRAVKRLMALGVQRNDAAGFIATYRALEAAGKLPQAMPAIIDLPSPPVVYTGYRVEKFAAVLQTSSLLPLSAIKKKLVHTLAEGLLDAGAITINRTEWSPNCMQRLHRPEIEEYTATIMVAKEEMT